MSVRTGKLALQMNGAEDQLVLSQYPEATVEGKESVLRMDNDGLTLFQ